MTMRVLIIDDDAEYLTAVTAFLQVGEGFEVAKALTINKGLEILASDPDLKVIVLDLKLPGGSGSVLLDKLRDDLGSYRIIFHTQYQELLPNDERIDFEFVKYIPKGNLVALRYGVKQAFQELENTQLNDRLEKLQNILKTMDEGGKELEALDLICEHLVESVGAYTCHIRILNFQQGDYELKAYAGPQDVSEIFSDNKKLNESFSGYIAKKGERKIYQEIQNVTKFKEFKATVYQRHISEATTKYFETVQSAYIVPIRTKLFPPYIQVDAVLNISGRERNFFTSERVQTVDNFITYVNLAISRFWLGTKGDEIHEDYKRSNNLLINVSKKLQYADLNRILQVVLKQISKIINAEVVSIFLYEEKTKRIANYMEYVGNKIQHNNQESYAPDECLTGHVFHSKKTLSCNVNPANHPRYISDKDMDLEDIPSATFEHYLGIPLKVGNRVIGVIRAINKKSSYYDQEYPSVAGNDFCLLSRGFSRDCKTILGIIANHLAVTIQNAELIGKQDKKIGQLKSLGDVSQRISSNYGLETKNLLGVIVKETAQVMKSAACMLFWKDDEKEQVNLQQCYGIPMIEDAFYALREGKTGQVAFDGIPICEAMGSYIGKYDDDVVRSLKKKKNGEDSRISSFMIAPIVIWDESPIRNNEIVGVLKVINKKSENKMFDEDDFELFQTFASQLSIAFVMSERSKSFFRLVQGIGHEFQNSALLNGPLTIEAREIVKETRLVAKKAKVYDFEDNFAFLDEILDTFYFASEKATDFTKDLLAFSEKRFQKKELMDVNELIRSEISELQKSPPPSVINSGEMVITDELSKQPLFCKIYEAPFRCAVRNIVSNAFQAMEKTKKKNFTIKSSQYRKKLEQPGRGKSKLSDAASIEFSDTGIGIEGKYIPHLFKSWFTKRDGGNGLGLWLVRMGLQRMDGNISVKSSVVGKGTTFTIDLPVKNPRNDRANNRDE